MSKYQDLNRGFFWVLFLCWTPSICYSFNGNEHKSIGNKALKIALDYNSIHCNNPSVNYKPACHLLDGISPNESYGEIIERIDFMISPNMMFTQIGSNLKYPKSHDELNPSFFGEFKDIEESYLRSSHNNESHFQGYLLFNLHDWHKRALTIAEKEKNLFSALIANAVSDHYLHDFFAPGHITTPRYNFHDTFALGMHDINNNLGAQLYIKNWNELQPILEFIQNNNDIYKFEDKVLAAMSSRNNSIYLHGDGFIKDNPKQELFMILVEIKSITEIIQCFNSIDKCNSTSFDTYNWETTTPGKGIKLSPPQAEIAYGRYEIKSDNLKLYSSVIGSSVAQETLFLNDGQFRWVANIEFAPFGEPGAPDFIRNKKTHEPFTSTNWGVALGYSYLGAKDYLAHGPQLRLIFAEPQLDLQYGVYLRYFDYQQDNDSKRKVAYGVRADIGFSLLTASFSIGKDYGYKSNNTLDGGLMASFGVTVSFPISRTPLISSLESKLYSYSGIKLPNN